MREIVSASTRHAAAGYTRLLKRVLQGDSIALDALGSMLVLTRVQVRYRRPAYYDDLLTLLAYRTEGFGLVNGHSPR